MKLNYDQAFFQGLCLALLIVMINALPTHGLVFPQLINSGHGLVFFFANLFLLKLILGVSNSFRKILLVGLFSIFVGFLIEWVQPYVGRSRSALDFYYDILGVFFSGIFFYRTNTSSKKLTTLLLILFFCLIMAFPAFRIYLWWQINNTPTLLNFERNWEESIYSIDKGVNLEKVSTADLLNKAGHLGKLNVEASDTYLGFSLNYPKSNWQTYKKLSWEVVSDHLQLVNMNLRIHDSKHNHQYQDRFNHRFEVKHGYNHFEISLNEVKQAPKFREMDMGDIQNLKFFLSKPDKKTTLYLDNVKLH